MIDAAGARPDDQRQRRRLFLVTLTALQFRYPPGAEPELIGWLKRWLGGWPGIGRITIGMARHGFDLQLTRYGEEDWRATFYAAGPGALADCRGGLRVAADPVGGRPAGGVGDAAKSGGIRRTVLRSLSTRKRQLGHEFDGGAPLP
jgi:hypothetical protein